MQGLWLGVTLSLWGVVLYTHGSMGVVVFGALAATLLGGAMVSAMEIDS
jgi:hypothetical protein